MLPPSIPSITSDTSIRGHFIQLGLCVIEGGPAVNAELLAYLCESVITQCPTGPHFPPAPAIQREFRRLPELGAEGHYVMLRNGRYSQMLAMRKRADLVILVMLGVTFITAARFPL